MDVYLMQHGEAVAAQDDPDRPLTDAGAKHVRAVASHAAQCGVTIDRVVHSGRTRAAQSAELLAAAIGCGDVGQVPGLQPNDDVDSLATGLVDRELPASVAIVGHLPFLERLVARLVVGRVEGEVGQVIALRNAGLVKLVPAVSGHGFAIAWAITPDIARP